MAMENTPPAKGEVSSIPPIEGVPSSKQPLAAAQMGRPATTGKGKPWEKAGVSRRTWYRLLKKGR